MNISDKKLGEEVLMHENVSVKNSQFGAYTEVGMFNFIENSSFDDYSYTGQFCFVQNTKIGKAAE